MRRRNRRITLAAGAALAGAVAAGALLLGRSAAVDEPRPPVVVFARGGDLWLMRPTGPERTSRLTHTGSWREGAAALSPDGRSVAYERRRASAGPQDSSAPQLVVAGIDGRDPHKISGPLGGAMPAWSPDGTRIAFGNRRGLWTVDSSGRDLRTLDVAGGCPSWSPDGTRIAFCGVGASTDATGVWIVGADGSNPRQLTRPAAQDVVAGWSPDGEKLVFTSDRAGTADVYAIRADGSGLRRLLAGPGSQSAEAWLPNGRVLFADWRRGSSRWGLLDPKSRRVHWLPALAGLEEPVDWWAGPTRVRKPPTTAGGARGGDRRLVAIASGRRLFLDCRGSARAQPTVVFDSGLGQDSQTWLAAQALVARRARACRYDRLGLGLSDPPPAGRRTASELVGDLHSLLRSGRVRPPYVLVGASFGGLDARLFAARYPPEVAALVLVDPLPPQFDRRLEPILGRAASLARRRQLERNGEGIDFGEILASDDEVQRASRRIDVPLVVIRHGLRFAGGPGFPSVRVERLWAELEDRTARLSRDGSVVVARGSHHRIAESEPDVVARAIARVLVAGRR